MRTVLFLLNRQLASDFYFYRDQVELIIIPPPPGNLQINPMDFSKADKMIQMAYTSTKAWFDEGGFHKQSELDPRLQAVHSLPVNLMEAVHPDPDIKAKARIKENISPITDKIKKNLSDAKQQVKDSIKEKTKLVKDKFKNQK